jgi:GNAT superfamily N-acetyltransferase
VTDERAAEIRVDMRDLNKERIRATKRRRSLALVLHWLLRPFGDLELTDVYKFDLTKLPPLFDVQGYRIEHANAGDIKQITQQIVRDEPSDVIEDLWAQGHHCFVAKYGGKVAAYNWIAFSAVQEEEYRYEPQAGHAICLDAYTVPEHRGKGLHLLLLLTMMHFAAASGKTLAYTGASLFNVVSWKTHLRIGWELEFTFGWFRPYFTRSRHPWRLCRERYPLRLDWSHHAWLVAKDRKS